MPRDFGFESYSDIKTYFDVYIDGDGSLSKGLPGDLKLMSENMYNFIQQQLDFIRKTKTEGTDYGDILQISGSLDEMLRRIEDDAYIQKWIAQNEQNKMAYDELVYDLQTVLEACNSEELKKDEARKEEEKRKEKEKLEAQRKKGKSIIKEETDVIEKYRKYMLDGNDVDRAKTFANSMKKMKPGDVSKELSGYTNKSITMFKMALQNVQSSHSNSSQYGDLMESVEKLEKTMLNDFEIHKNYLNFSKQFSRQVDDVMKMAQKYITHTETTGIKGLFASSKVRNRKVAVTKSLQEYMKGIEKDLEIVKKLSKENETAKNVEQKTENTAKKDKNYKIFENFERNNLSKLPKKDETSIRTHNGYLRKDVAYVVVAAVAKACIENDIKTKWPSTFANEKTREGAMKAFVSTDAFKELVNSAKTVGDIRKFAADKEAVKNFAEKLPQELKTAMENNKKSGEIIKTENAKTDNTVKELQNEQEQHDRNQQLSSSQQNIEMSGIFN